MRVPFPFKVFLSYLAVIALGAIPTYVYIQTAVADEVVEHRLGDLADRVATWAEELKKIPREQRKVTVQRVAEFETDRVSYIDHRGVVLFDSRVDAQKLNRQHETPEFIAVHSDETKKREKLNTGIAGVSANRRFSTIADSDTLFVAAKIEDGERAEIVRIAYPIGKAGTLSDKLLAFFRNSQAVAISAAFLFSLLAAFVFMRPLQRLVRSANAIAEGDFDASQKWEGYDEIGDVGNALNKLALELRQRLAVTEASQSILLQAIDHSDTPMALLSPSSEIVVVNGAFRELLGDAINAEDAIAKLVSSKKWGKALKAASKTEVPIVLDWAHKKTGRELTVHILDTAHSEPMSMLSSRRDTPTMIPQPDQISISSVSELVDSARKNTNVKISDIFDADTKTTEVVDSGGRIELAMRTLWETTDAEVALHGQLSDYLVEIWFRYDVDEIVLSVARSLVHPIGGDVRRDDDDVVLSLRRA